MFIVLLLLILAMSFVLILNALALSIAEKALFLREEMTSFECGFEHFNLSRVPFSLRYFFLTMIFLLFDLEIVLMIFLPSAAISSCFYTSALAVLSFVLMLFLSLVYEWVDGSLEWLN